MKKLLIYRWGAISEPLLCDMLNREGYSYVELAMKIKNYHADAEFAMAFMQKLHGSKADMVFSYNYFPLISMICQINQIPYISWIYDCPLKTLYSQTVTNPCNYIFCFDKVQCEQIRKLGAVHCYHYPLAGDLNWAEKAFGQCKDEVAYKSDICFLGNLYNEDKNRYRKAVFTPEVKAELESLIDEQMHTYGTFIVDRRMSEKAAEEVVEKCQLYLSPEYTVTPTQLAVEAVGMEVSARERELVLRTIGRKHKMRLHTTSKLPADLNKENYEIKGYADYIDEVPLVFKHSKINLNISSKTITSGIPQRVFDILICGGFCLTNYQPEIAEYFKEDQELVMYRSMEELMDKTDYYLSHEEERRAIALNGQNALKERFLLKDCFAKMLQVVEES
ncbi:MAG: glycosyltransferase [Lachnospiraceae bacterium]|nr:glycosyltransferase [Lachnospiraceae bacterium]